MELYDAKTDSYKKPYIRQAWLLCDLIDDWQRVTKDGQPVNVWRVEFSLRSAVKNWIAIEIDGIEKNYQSLRNTLDCYMGRDRLLVIFASLANHYFHFKKYKQGVRKDRCEDKILFDFSSVQRTYKIGRDDYAAGSGQTFREKYTRLIAKLRAYKESHLTPEIFKACEVLISSMTEEDLRSDMASPWSNEELMFIRSLMSLRSRHPELSVDVAMSEIKNLLSITDRTIKTF